MTQQKTMETENRNELPTPGMTPDVYECVEFLTDWNQNLATFYFDRMQQYLKIPFDVQGLSSPDENVKQHEQFLSKMRDDYVGQSEKMLELARNNVCQSDSASTSGYEANLLKAQADAAKIIDQAKVQAERIIAAANAKAGEIVAQPATQAAKSTRRKSA